MKKLVLMTLAVVMAVALVGSSIPVFGAELSIMRTRHFIDAWEAEWDKLVVAFETANPGVKVRNDFVALSDFEIKLSSEAEARKGHDIVGLRQADPLLYKNSLATINDTIERIIAVNGEPLPLAVEFCVVDGDWKAVPQDRANQPSRLMVRIDMWEQVGYSRDMIWNLDWDMLLDASKKLYAIDRPIGMAISQWRGDTHHWIVPFLWSFGSHISDANLNVTIDSANTYAALEYAKKLYKYMAPGVIAWDEGGDNRWMLSGLGSGGLSNAGSIYSQAYAQDKPFAKYIEYAPNPIGPAGRFVEGFLAEFGVWDFAENKELAKEFLYFYHMNIEALIIASKPTALPTWAGIKIKFTDPQIEIFSPPIPEESHHGPGWPGPVSQAEVKAYRACILPIMIGKVSTGMATQDAIDWAEKELEKIYSEERLARGMAQ